VIDRMIVALLVQSSGNTTKQVMPTQRSSALNEYRIGCVLMESTGGISSDGVDKNNMNVGEKGDGNHQDEEDERNSNGANYCMTYLDKAEQGNHLWLLLRRVTPSSYGVDLSEYIANGFFVDETHQQFAREITLQLLEGLEHIGCKNVIMRDVKSDNVLIESEVLLDGTAAYRAKWSDYGLAVHVGNDRCEGLRSPDALQQNRPSGSIGVDADDEPAKARVEALVGFWYVCMYMRAWMCSYIAFVGLDLSYRN
jgi:serine/threonine protein kinase